jgi:hypothetical protein
MKLRELQAKLDSIETDIRLDPRISDLKNKIRAERQAEIDDIKSKIKQLRDKQPKKKTERWPENTPENVKVVCEKYWNGTTESSTYRIHQWNNKAVWTSYPSGGYSSNGGWNPTPSHYYLVSLNEEEYGLGRKKGKVLKELSFERNSGKRVTPAMMKEELDKLS